MSGLVGSATGFWVPSGADYVTTNLQLNQDVNNYSSGQSWVDSTANGYVYYLGATSGSESSDPTYNAGSPAYWSFDGGDYFTQSATYSGSIMMSIGKQSQSFTVEAWLYMASFTGNPSICCSNPGGGGNGFTCSFAAANSKMNFTCEPSGSNFFSTSAISTSAWHQVAWAGKCDGTTITMYTDGSSNGTGTINNSGWTSGDASNNMRIAANPTPSQMLTSGSRLAILRIYDADIGSAGITQNWNANRARFGL